MYEPFTLAGIPYPWRAEQSHTMLVGTTGSGKSTVMKDLLKQIRARRGRAVVFDLTGTFIETFYNPHTDIILNPFDARCPKWSPFSDAHTREHFQGSQSLALVPMSDGGGEQFWPESARMIFVETCVRLVEQGRGNAQALSDVLMTSKLKDLHAHVLRTVAAPLTDPEAKRMAESIRATFNTYAQALLTLPTEGRDFSVRDWVLASETQADDPNRHSSVLFVAAQHVNLRSVRVLLTMWLSTAINTLMSMPGDQRDIRLWLLLDEIGALHNIPAIVSGMQTARNYGGAFVLGVHTIAQLKETYGDNYAETIASLAKTKLLMNTRDRASQEWESGQVGDGEWSEMEENWSYGANNVRDACDPPAQGQTRAAGDPERVRRAARPHRIPQVSAGAASGAGPAEICQVRQAQQGLHRAQDQAASTADTDPRAATLRRPGRHQSYGGRRDHRPERRGFSGCQVDQRSPRTYARRARQIGPGGHAAMG